jgi:HPt (histidine-containing phosphotransfer) domain-containing protein
MIELAVERKTLLEALENDTQLLNEVVEIFLTDYPGKLAELRTAVTARNCNQIASGSHALRGSIGIFGAKIAAKAAQKLESMGRQEQMESVDEEFAVLEHEMALVASALEQIAKDAL